MRPHNFTAVNEPGNRPNERDIIRTMECKRCTMRHVVTVSTGESHGGMLQRFPDCDEFIAMGVHNA